MLKSLTIQLIGFPSMMKLVRELLDTQDSKTFDKLYERIEKYEGISDNMEIEIAKYLDQVERLHELGLAAPDTVELMQRLNRQGEHLPLTAITVEECADALYRRFGAEGK